MRAHLLCLAFLPVALLVLSACAGGGSATSADPLADVRNDRLRESRRREAIHTLWNRVEAGELDRLSIRDDLKTIAWSPAWPTALRIAALEALASDTTDAGRDDTRGMFRLMLPRESDPEVTAFLSQTAAERGWEEATSALIRSLARLWPGIPEQQRPEYAALVALNPGRAVEEIAYDLFLAADEHTGPRSLSTPERIRTDAWDLLARLDLDGSRRADLILRDGAPAIGPVEDMRALLRDMRALPLTGEELRWLASLRDFSDPVRQEWWNTTSSIIAQLDESHTGHIQMRHLEPIRWTAEHHPEWLERSRSELFSKVSQRLAGRQFHRRTPHPREPRPPADRIGDWAEALRWGDLLAILVIDEAVHQPQVIEALFRQAEQDRRDRNAEHGGLLRAARGSGGLGGPRFEAVHYPPRPGDRRGDHQFIAPRDMIDQGFHAVAHYHFHAQTVRNHEYAGPSPADLIYAARFGHNCLVFTTVGTGAINVDFYQPDGIVVDLGTIRQQ